MSDNNNKDKVTLSDLSNGAIPTTATPVGMPVKPKLDKSTIREANLAEAVLPSEADKPVEGTGNPMLDIAFEGLDSTVERLQKESTEIYNEGQEQRIQEAIDNDNDDDSIDEEDDILETATPSTIKVNKFEEGDTIDIVHPPFREDTTPKEEVQITKKAEEPEMVESEVDVSAPVAGTKKETIKMVQDTSIYDEDEDDHLFDGVDEEDMHFLDDDEETEEEKEAEEVEKDSTETIKQSIREEINKNFNPVNKLDLSKFTISKKPINASKVISEIKTKAIECADGVLFSEKRAIRMSAWKPMEIQSIDPNRIRGGQSNYNKFIENKLKLIYNHIIDANKPKTFEAWAMLTPNTVMDDYMFTSYKATFGTANIITFTCNDDKCNNVFMENVPVHSMMKFRNDEIKEEYGRILREGNTDSSNSEYKVELYQASDEYVFALKIPSLYNTYIEPTLVDQRFNEKYEDLLLLLSYIDGVYMIDPVNKQLIPIDTKPIKNDKTTSYKRRVKTYATILKSLTSDQLQALSIETDKYDAGVMDDDGNIVRDITYVYPERRCPKCGKKIDEVEVSPDNMLFTRHQLGLMKKI